VNFATFFCEHNPQPLQNFKVLKENTKIGWFRHVCISSFTLTSTSENWSILWKKKTGQESLKKQGEPNLKTIHSEHT